MGWLRPSFLVFILFIFAASNVKSDTVTSTDETRIDTSTKAETPSSTTEKDGPRVCGGLEGEEFKKCIEKNIRFAMDHMEDSGISGIPKTNRSLSVAERYKQQRELLDAQLPIPRNVQSGPGNHNNFAGRLKERTEQMNKKPSTEPKIQSGQGDDDEDLTEDEKIKKQIEEAGHSAMDEAQRWYPDLPRTDRSMPAAERNRVLQEWLNKKQDAADEHFKSRPDTSNSYNSYNSYPSHNSNYNAHSSLNRSERSYGRSSSIAGFFVGLLFIVLIIGGIVACCVMAIRGNGRRGGNMPMYNARNEYANTPLDGSLVQKNYAVRGSVATATPKSVTPVTKTTSKEVTNSKIGETSVEVV